MRVIKEGVYFLKKEGVVVYIGESDNILRRIGQHISDGKKDFDSFEVYPTADRKRLEAFLIKTLRPKYNIADGKCAYCPEDWFPATGEKEAIEAYEKENEYIPIREIEREIGFYTRHIISVSVKNGFPVCLIDGHWRINRAFLNEHKKEFIRALCMD